MTVHDPILPLPSATRRTRRSARVALAALAAATAALSPALAEDVASIVRTAKGLMDSGRYVRCGLDMKPSEGAGYYRCFEFGLYRVVEDYPRLSVFVTGEDAPFRIFAAENGRGSFLFSGPWTTDLAPRLAKHAADAVSKKDADPSAEARRLDAEARLGKLIDSERPKPPPEPAPEPPLPAPAAQSAGGRDQILPPVAGNPGAPVGDAALRQALEAAGLNGRR